MCLYISIPLRTGSLMSGLSSLSGIYFGRFDVSVMFAKCLEKTSATVALSERITSYSIIIGFFLGPDLSEKKGLRSLQPLFYEISKISHICSIFHKGVCIGVVHIF